jgi:hypothetical protein
MARQQQQNREAVRSHREVLASTKAAVAAWGQENEGPYLAAESILILLDECERDTDGEATLDALSSIFDEYDDVITSQLAGHFAALTNAAHRLGRNS